MPPGGRRLIPVGWIVLITKGAKLDSAPLFISDLTVLLTGVPVFRVRSTHFIFFAQNAFFVKCVDLTPIARKFTVVKSVLIVMIRKNKKARQIYLPGLFCIHEQNCLS
jgi:hypothetical protein